MRQVAAGRRSRARAWPELCGDLRLAYSLRRVNTACYEYSIPSLPLFYVPLFTSTPNPPTASLTALSHVSPIFHPPARITPLGSSLNFAVDGSSYVSSMMYSVSYESYGSRYGGGGPAGAAVMADLRRRREEEGLKVGAGGAVETEEREESLSRI